MPKPRTPQRTRLGPSAEPSPAHQKRVPALNHWLAPVPWAAGRGTSRGPGRGPRSCHQLIPVWTQELENAAHPPGPWAPQDLASTASGVGPKCPPEWAHPAMARVVTCRMAGRGLPRGWRAAGHPRGQRGGLEELPVGRRLLRHSAPTAHTRLRGAELQAQGRCAHARAH